jgi:3-methyl-2-oxobutanoate hydroxymethyltransferase
MSSTTAPLYGGESTSRVTITDLAAAKARGERWPMLTAYDATTAAILDDAGIPVLLVGDSAATVIFGYDNTIPVTTEELLPLVRGVVRGSKRALVVADLPFGSYQSSVAQAIETGARFLKEGLAHAVKLEGGTAVLPQVRAMTAAGIPVMAHLGLTPQSVHQLGGYSVQGRGAEGERIVEEALALQDAGAFSLVLEVVPSELATRITHLLHIPVIGIGAGNGTDAQVLVIHDLVGMTRGRTAKFVKPYAALADSMRDAVQHWADDVATATYPSSEHSYT